jgi:hypothetical protein
MDNKILDNVPSLKKIIDLFYDLGIIDYYKKDDDMIILKSKGSIQNLLLYMFYIESDKLFILQYKLKDYYEHFYDLYERIMKTITLDMTKGFYTKNNIPIINEYECISHRNRKIKDINSRDNMENDILTSIRTNLVYGIIEYKSGLINEFAVFVDMLQLSALCKHQYPIYYKLLNVENGDKNSRYEIKFMDDIIIFNVVNNSDKTMTLYIEYKNNGFACNIKNIDIYNIHIYDMIRFIADN